MIKNPWLNISWSDTVSIIMRRKKTMDRKTTEVWKISFVPLQIVIPRFLGKETKGADGFIYHS